MKRLSTMTLIYRFIFSISVFGVFALLSGCVSEADMPDEIDPDQVRFHASLDAPEGLSTRANNKIYDVTPEFYDCTFYARGKGKDQNGRDVTAFGTYNIPSGYSGTLAPIDGMHALNWFSRNYDHNFWLWSAPFDLNHNPKEADLAKGYKFQFKNTYISDLKNNDTKPNWTDDSWKNGIPLEQFIGGKTSKNYRYNIDGMYVPVTMRHLVSKIMVKDFNVIDNFTGTVYSKLRGEIIIYGLPNEATFYPAYIDKDGNETAPRVEMPKNWAYDNSKGVTYVAANYPKYYYWEGITDYQNEYYFRDSWYICPEVDLSKLSFKVQLYEYVYNDETKQYEWIEHRTRGTHGAFYGDFRNVKFSRSSNGNNYDDAENPGSDATILHAGEYLALRLNLYEKGSPVIHGEIYSSWWVGHSDAPAQVEQGLYTYLDINDLNSVMGGSDKQAQEDYFAIKGSGRDTGSDPEGEYPDYEELYGKELNIFEIYDDIGGEDYNSSYKIGSLKTADGYILDGKGHTINCSSTTISVGNVRDVYLHYYSRSGSDPYYTYTEYMIYIDKMGNIYTVNLETFEETPTGKNINDSKTNPKKIDLTTGKF